MCTLHSFPHNIDHCLTYARSEFEGMFEKGPTEANAYLADPEKYVATVRASSDAAARDQLENVVTVLADERCSTFEECVAWARHVFQVPSPTLPHVLASRMSPALSSLRTSKLSVKLCSR